MGVLIYAWSPAITAHELADVLRRVGGDFAMHLDLGARGNGLEYFFQGVDSDLREFAHPEMDIESPAGATPLPSPFSMSMGRACCPFH